LSQSITHTGTEMRSYYGHAVIKEPTWTWQIPVYFFTGGLGGASSVLGLGAKLFGNEKLSRTALYIGAAADTVSAPLLIADLGRPERFHHMLRVFKVTSPMNMGAWILTFAGGASNTAAMLELLGILKPVKILAELVASLFGPPLATYTGVLVANTAVPAWHEARYELPWLFGCGGAATAGAAAGLFLPPAEARPARRLAIVGAAAELAFAKTMERRLGETGEVYRHGAAGAFSKAANALTGAGIAVLAARGSGSRGAQVLGGALVLAGAMCMRWTVYEAGRQSARDPKYTVKPQRARAERDGTKATVLPGTRV
jgi:formate-dependent nitrite reductase membrane component NrfD